MKKEELYGGAPCQDVMWEASDCSNPDSASCPAHTTSTTTLLTLLKLPEGELAWSHLHNVWEPQASRGPLAIPSQNDLSKNFTESKDPSYRGQAYKPCPEGELDKMLAKMEALKKQPGGANSTEASAVKVIDEVIANVSVAKEALKQFPLPFNQEVGNWSDLAKTAAGAETNSSKDFTDAFESNQRKLKDGRDVVAEVAGDLGLDVMEADEFVGSSNVSVAVEKAIASLAGAQDADVKVDITIPQAMLLSDWQRKMKGNVNVAYMVEVYKQDASKGNASALASRISTLDINSVTSEVRQQVILAGLTFTLRAVSLSVTVLPVTTDGSIDALDASSVNSEMLQNSLVEDAVPTAVLDGKAKAPITANAMVETAHRSKLQVAQLHRQEPVLKETEERRYPEPFPGGGQQAVHGPGDEGRKSAALACCFPPVFFIVARWLDSVF